MTQTVPRRLTVWVLGALTTLSPLAIDLYLPAFNEIARDFRVLPATIALTVSSYFIGSALGQIFYGPLLDRFGRKIPLYIGLAIFMLTSLGCMLSINRDMLVAFRFVQGLSGSVAWVAAIAMVRDFYPVEDAPRIFSLLVLILGVSPLLGPTIGGFIALHFSWRVLFLTLVLIALFLMLLVRFFLIGAKAADKEVSIRVKAMVVTYKAILKFKGFHTYAFAGAFSFSTLFVYVAASPIIFMQHYTLSPQAYSLIFALIAGGFLLASQLNVVLGKRIRPEKVFRVTLLIQLISSALFLSAALVGFLNVYSTFFFLFVCLSCIGMSNPNASALALAPFSRHVGSASALLGFVQTGISALVSVAVAPLGTYGLSAIVSLFFVTTLIAVVILFWAGRRSPNSHSMVLVG